MIPKAANVVDKNEPTELAKLRAHNKQLQKENARLRKTNGVLIRRIEQGWGNHSDAYQTFENAVLLAEKSQEKVAKLSQIIAWLEKANQQTTKAQQETRLAQQRLADSVESIFDAFALFDDQHRIILANNRFYELWARTNTTIVSGKTSLSDLVRNNLSKGLFIPQKTRQTEQPTDRFGNNIYRLQNKRWVQTSEKQTLDGGLVLTFTDITYLKNTEARQREEALEQQARLLASTINNMSQGVTLVDANDRVLVWNEQFVKISGIAHETLKKRPDFKQLIANHELCTGPELLPVTAHSSAKGVFEHEKTLADGRVILLRRHIIPGGGFVNTYTDITERSQQQQALRDSEERIRLITDAVPALIAYINNHLVYEFANQQAKNWFGCENGDIEGRSMPAILGEDHFARHKKHVERALKGELVEFEVEEKTCDKNIRISHKTYVPHFAANTKVVGFFALEQDVSRQHKTERALKAAYEELEERVEQRTREISEINETLREQIREKCLIETHLLEAKREAEAANISKTKFLAATSHDLLQPLNAAVLFASLLKQKALPAEIQGVVQSLSYSLENIESLIGTLIDISKLEAGVIKPELGVFNINELMTNLANEFRQQTGQKNIRFHLVPSTAIVYTDSQLLARILRNFLTNALRYTQNGHVLLGARRRPEGLEIQVVDTGVGIPTDEMDKIFNEFHRSEAHRTLEDRGLGLGLAIVDKISHMLGHQIKVDSVLGKGSCFSVVVPYASTPCQTSMTPLEMPAVSIDKALQNCHVVVIDNDVSICDGMSSLLQGWGCEVITLHSNAQIQNAIRKGFQPIPDLVIADYHLNDGLSGLEVIQKINDGENNNIPVLMITANYSVELRQQVRKLGYHLLNKPVKPVKLKMAMNHVLGNAY